MLGKSMSIKGMIIAIIFVTLGFTQVSLEIKNVNLTAGTLDIFMTNNKGCSFWLSGSLLSKLVFACAKVK